MQLDQIIDYARKYLSPKLCFKRIKTDLMAPIGKIKAFIVPNTMKRGKPAIELFPAMRSLRNNIARARQQRGDPVEDDDIFDEPEPIPEELKKEVKLVPKAEAKPKPIVNNMTKAKLVPKVEATAKA